MDKFFVAGVFCALTLSHELTGAQLPSGPARPTQAPTSPTPKLDAAYIAAMKKRTKPWPAEQILKWCEDQRALGALAVEARLDERLTRDQATEPISKRFPIYVRRGEPTELLTAMVHMIDVVYDQPAERFDRGRVAAMIYDSCIRAATVDGRLSSRPKSPP